MSRGVPLVSLLRRRRPSPFGRAVGRRPLYVLVEPSLLDDRALLQELRRQPGADASRPAQ